jgi:hypothetical protein
LILALGQVKQSHSTRKLDVRFAMKALITKKQLLPAIVLMFTALIIFAQPIVASSPALKLDGEVKALIVYAVGDHLEFISKFEISPELIDFATIAAIGLILFCLSTNRSVVSNNTYHRRPLK